MRVSAPFATRRFLILFLLGSWPLVLSLMIPELLPLGLGFDGFLLLLFLSDWVAAPGPRQLRVEREVDRVWFQGSERLVTLRIQNRAAASCVIELEDRLPSRLEASGATAIVRMSGGARLETSYRARAMYRGVDQWHGIALRVRGPLGLGGKSWLVVDDRPCQVLPEARVSGRLPLGTTGPVRRRRATSPRIPERGDFDRLREYALGDDPRIIDWKASARRAHLVTRQYACPRRERVVMAIDCGRWMAAPSGDFTRLDRAVGAAAALATAAIGRGDRVGLVAFDREVRATRALGQGRAHLRSLIDDLTALASAPCESSNESALVATARLVPRRALLVWFTDLTDSRQAARLAASLRPWHRRFLPICVCCEDEQVRQWAEAEPSFIRDVYRRVVAGDVLDEQERARRHLERSRVLTVFARADQLSRQLLDLYTRVKRQALL